MTSVEVTLGKYTYPLCYSLGVMKKIEEKFGSTDEMLEAMSFPQEPEEGDAVPPEETETRAVSLMPLISAYVWLLSAMLEAGARKAALDGLDTDTPPTEAQLLDLLGPEDLVDIQGKLLEAMHIDSARAVEVAPPKKDEAAPAGP